MTITIGCDPEFLVTDSNGYHMNFNLNYSDNDGNFGPDHGGNVGELRPRHGTPAKVTENIRKQLMKIKELLPNARLSAGGGGNSSGSNSIGGHIHFGGIQLSLDYSSSTRTHFGHRRRYNRFSIAPSCPENKLVLALDYYIGLRLQKVSGGKRPTRSNYGKASDIETKHHSGGGFEYRTPPSWLTDPYLTEATLAIAKRIAEMWQENASVFDSLWKLQIDNSLLHENQISNALQAATEEKILRKKYANKSDYDFLIPESGSSRTDSKYHDYMKTQIKRFKQVLFSKTYKMDNPELLDLWSNQEKLNTLYGVSESVMNTIAILNRTNSTIRAKRIPIMLQNCQIKRIDRKVNEFNQIIDFDQEIAIGRCQFAVPEIQVYQFGEYTPWQFRITGDERLKNNVLYLSKNLRPFLKIKRGQFKVKFVDMQRRIPEVGLTQHNGSLHTLQHITNFVFYKKDVLESIITDNFLDCPQFQNPNDIMEEKILELFSTCARKKLRKIIDSNAQDYV